MKVAKTASNYRNYSTSVNVNLPKIDIFKSRERENLRSTSFYFSTYFFYISSHLYSSNVGMFENCWWELSWFGHCNKNLCTLFTISDTDTISVYNDLSSANMTLLNVSSFRWGSLRNASSSVLLTSDVLWLNESITAPVSARAGTCGDYHLSTRYSILYWLPAESSFI